MSVNGKQFLEEYDTHSDALFRYCYVKIGDREVAKDIVQDVFMKIWVYIQEGNEVLHLKALLYRTASNLIIDRYRKKQTVSLDLLQETGFDPEDDTHEHVIDGPDAKFALTLVSQLPEPFQQAVYLRYVDGLELSEIAEISGVSTGTVAVRVHRGVAKLRKLFFQGHEQST